MGEAKRRGSREQRIAAASQRLEELRPAFIECEDCGEKNTNVDHIPMKDHDAEALFAARCENCGCISPHACYTPLGEAKMRRWIKEEEANGSNSHLACPTGYIKNFRQ